MFAMACTSSALGGFGPPLAAENTPIADACLGGNDPFLAIPSSDVLEPCIELILVRPVSKLARPGPSILFRSGPVGGGVKLPNR